MAFLFFIRLPTHAARVRRLRELAAERLEALAGRVDVGDRDAEVAEAALHLKGVN